MKLARPLAVGAALAVAIAAAVVSSSNAATVPAPTPPSDVVSSSANTTASATISYWTPSRMATAKPYPMPVRTRKAAPLKPNSTAVTGTPGAIAGSATTSSAFAAHASAATTPAPTAFTYPYPYTRFTVYPTSLWRLAPWRVNGKLFFTQNGSNYVCSATSVVAPSRIRVWTAGHCVSDGSNTFNTSAVFVPAYNGNSTTLSIQRPYGSFPATSFTTTTAWHTSGDLSRDYGAIRVGLNSAGQQLTTAVGSAGFAWNQADLQQWQDDAYPQAAPFNGKNMIECQAATAVRDTGIGGSGPAPMGIGCDMTGGSSGGSWRMRSGGGSVGYINGLNSYKYLSPSQPLAMYGPYFDTLANTVRCSGETPGSLGC